MDEPVFDMIIIGRGPVGLAMAATLAQDGHSVAVVERHRDLYGLPRAGHIDHEIVRILQSLGAAEPVLADSYPTTEYVWKNAAGETLLEFDWGAKGMSGYNSDYMYFQPIMERALGDCVAGSRLATEYCGWELTDFRDTGNGVDVTLRAVTPGQAQPAGNAEVRAIRGRYLVAADGANSTIRRRLGIARDDLGFNERWLVVDVRKKRPLTLEFDCGQICDPARPITVLPLGKRHRRWEWAMLPGETVEELERPETAWRLLADWNVTPEDAEIVRQLVYTFEARLATEWRRDRVFLMGDACHTMPPFMGQGMCSGVTLQLIVILILFAPFAALNDDTQPVFNIKYAAIVERWSVDLLIKRYTVIRLTLNLDVTPSQAQIFAQCCRRQISLQVQRSKPNISFKCTISN